MLIKLLTLDAILNVPNKNDIFVKIFLIRNRSQSLNLCMVKFIFIYFIYKVIYNRKDVKRH